MRLLQGIYSDLLEIKGNLMFLFVCLFTFLILLIKKNFIENEIAAFEVLEQEGKMGFFYLIQSLQYLSIPVIYLWKFLVITFLLWISCFFFGFKISFTRLWKVVVISEMIFFVPEFLKIGHFILVHPDPELFEVQRYYPLSLMSLFDPETIPARWRYPLKSLNVFEVFYWFLLVTGLQVVTRKFRNTSWLIVFAGYVLFFLLWLGYYVLIYK